MTTSSLNEETAKKVLRQVEFYFSDSNLPRDRFLKKTISENEDGLVSLALICSFSRMKSHLNLGDAKPDGVSEESVQAVAEVLRKSSSLKISEDGKKVGRAAELLKPEEVIEQAETRTIAASPLPYDTHLEDVESFFSQHAKVNSVRLPRHVADKKLFCGTALIEFATEGDAENILKQSLAYGGADLELTQKKDFDSKRAKEEDELGKHHPDQGLNCAKNSNGGANEGGNDYYPKGLIVAFSLKKASQEEPNDCKTSVTSDSTEKVPDEEGNCEGNVEEKENEEESVEKDEEKGACRDRKDVVMREDLKEVFRKFGTVMFIDFKIGESSGYIRFEEAEGAQKARAAAVLAEEGGLAVKNFTAALEPVTGVAEREYWTLLRGNQERRRESSCNRGRGGRHRFHGKRGRSRENNTSSGRPNKMQKVGAA